jgi:hypothetical protein
MDFARYVTGALALLALHASQLTLPAVTNTNRIAWTSIAVTVNTNGVITSPTNGPAWFRLANDLAQGTQVAGATQDLAATIGTVTNLLPGYNAASGLAFTAVQRAGDTMTGPLVIGTGSRAACGNAIVHAPTPR